MYRERADPGNKRSIPGSSQGAGVDLPLVGIPRLDPPAGKGLTGAQGEPATSTDPGTDVEVEPVAITIPAKVIPLYDNLYVVAPEHDRRDEDDKAQMQNAIRDDVDSYDPPEGDRIYAIATRFVANHVRAVRRGKAIGSTDRVSAGGTLVVSEKKVQHYPFPVTPIDWAIEGNRVIEAHGRRIGRWRLGGATVPSRRFIWAPGKGDGFDLGYFLANVCAILNMRVPVPIAAIGDVGVKGNQILGDRWMIEERRQTLRENQIRHLILPVRAGFMPGDHSGVRYWPVYDTNHAFVSLLAASASDQAASAGASPT
jgi:hypothetical protein